MSCRFCDRPVVKFLDLGTMPLANNFPTAEKLRAGVEPAFPLDLHYCGACGLVQIGHIVPPESIFRDYIYFSTTSDLVHRHADYLVRSFQDRFGLRQGSLIVEIASNDGTVLKYFQRAGIRALGVEPATNVAKVAVQAGIETVNDFFQEASSERIRRSHGPADVILARHVFAHVPDIHGFVRGLPVLLAPQGVIAVESPYLVDFIEKNEFDTVYHEHYSYLSVRAMSHLFDRYGMEIFDVERVPIHGGSIIYFIARKGVRAVDPRVIAAIEEERGKGLDSIETYRAFARRTAKVKDDLLALLRDLKRSGKQVAAYGAPAKGNTLMNYCGITTDLVSFTVDKSPYKQNHYTPGSHIPIYHPDRLLELKPDYALLLSWNFKDEILEQQRPYRDAGGKFIVPIPRVEVI